MLLPPAARLRLFSGCLCLRGLSCCFHRFREGFRAPGQLIRSSLLTSRLLGLLGKLLGSSLQASAAFPKFSEACSC